MMPLPDGLEVRDASVVEPTAVSWHALLRPRRGRAGAAGAEGVCDVVVEAAGSEQSLARCAELVAPGGTIVVLGVHFGPVQLNWMALFQHEARVIASLGYGAHRARPARPRAVLGFGELTRRAVRWPG